MNTLGINIFNTNILLQVFFISATPIQAILSIHLAPLVLNELGYRKPKKLLKLVNIFDIFINLNKDN